MKKKGTRRCPFLFDDFVHDKLSNGRSYKMLTVLDELTRQALCVEVQDKMNSDDVCVPCIVC